MKNEDLIIIGIPCNYEIVYKAFTISLTTLDRRFVPAAVWASSPYIWDMRNDLVKSLLSTDYGYIFMIDVDMKFPANAINAAYALKDRFDIVGVPYQNPKGDRLHVYKHMRDYLWRQVPPGILAQAPCEVDAVGTGLILISRKVFEKIEFPWFDGYMRDKIIGEDMIFCKKAKEAGFTIGITKPLQGVKHLHIDKETM